MLARKLTERDLDAYWDLRLRALLDNPEAFGATYEETVARGKESMRGRLTPSADFFTLGAFDEDGTLVGTVRFHREDGAKDRHKGFVYGTYVAHERRGQGVGKALMLELISQARLIEGLEQLHLGVITANPAAIALYSALGFQIYGTAQRALKQGEQYWDEHLMVLHLVK